jgi:enamine deaminase RidA (YjgF/YER057c/UK114 family)
MTTTQGSTATPRAASTAALQLDYVSSNDIAAQPEGWWHNVLGVVGFASPPLIDAARVPVTASMTPTLHTDATLCEVWRVAGAVPRLSNGASQKGRVRFRCSEDLLFGCITVAEHSTEADGESSALMSATESAYQEIFAMLKQTGHRHLIRIWNYLPDINRHAGGDERYRLFNSARQLAFRKSGQATVGTVPAASALGSPAGSPISIYFLAARAAPTMIENPRQTSAYDYPPKFGRHSPLFSRACVLNAAGTNLFVSGTASIVGHETIHQGSVEAQTRETMANIGALLDEANRVTGFGRYSLDRLKFKVYVRRPADRVAIERVLAQSMSTTTPVVYLQADVCREELLMEIEATGESGGHQSG